MKKHKYVLHSIIKYTAIIIGIYIVISIYFSFGTSGGFIPERCVFSTFWCESQSWMLHDSDVESIQFTLKNPLDSDVIVNSMDGKFERCSDSIIKSANVSCYLASYKIDSDEWSSFNSAVPISQNSTAKFSLDCPGITQLSDCKKRQLWTIDLDYYIDNSPTLIRPIYGEIYALPVQHHNKTETPINIKIKKKYFSYLVSKLFYYWQPHE